MSAITHPGLKALLAQTGEELVLAQVVIRRAGSSFELRHVADCDRPVASLRESSLSDLRALAQFTSGGAFRPLKSAPNLARGWRFIARDQTELEAALNCLYPGAVADWSAAQSPQPPVTNYREFTGRQTGMYRITATLGDTQAARATQACCHRQFCLKQRLWTVNGLAPDTVEEKSLIPCLEPCAILLEFARKTVRMEQEVKAQIELSPEEVATLAAALQIALAHSEGAGREADFDAPANPRRLRMVLEKLAALPIKPTVATEKQI